MNTTTILMRSGNYWGIKKQKGWRVSRYLGIDPAHQIGEWVEIEDDPEQADLMVLDDANLGFRDHPELWPKVLSNPEQPALGHL